ncbi:MAG: hypothetical protein ACN6PB_20375 [Achromobacter kerstersii]
MPSLNKQGSLLASAWIDDKDAALRYIAALAAMRDRAAASANCVHGAAGGARTPDPGLRRPV